MTTERTKTVNSSIKKPLVAAVAALGFTLGGSMALAGNGKHMEGYQPEHDATKGHTAECSEEHAKQHMASDAWLQGKIETTYLLNRHLNNFSIDSDVQCAHLTLSGNVESDIDRDLAEEIAKGIKGFKSIDNELVVAENKGQGPTMAEKAGDTARGFAQNVEEATTTAMVKTQLLVNGNVSGTDINVDTKGDTVILTGEVSTSAEKDLAEKLAANTNGVTDVRNKLKVASGNS